jgi:hypothetical protein
LNGKTVRGGALRIARDQVADIEARLASATESGMTVSALAGTLGDKLRAAEKERDAIRAQLETRDRRIAGLEASGRADVEKAVKTERARCLELVETFEPDRAEPSQWSREGALAIICERIRAGE